MFATFCLSIIRQSSPRSVICSEETILSRKSSSLVKKKFNCLPERFIPGYFVYIQWSEILFFSFPRNDTFVSRFLKWELVFIFSSFQKAIPKSTLNRYFFRNICVYNGLLLTRKYCCLNGNTKVLLFACNRYMTIHLFRFWIQAFHEFFIFKVFANFDN